MSKERSPTWRGLAATILIGLFPGLILFSWLRSVDQSDPNALAGGIPVEPPREEYRVFHPSGFSIIRPSAWDSKTGVGSGVGEADGVKLASPHQRKPQAVMFIIKYTVKPEIGVRGRVREIQFQGRPALMAVEHRPAEFMEHPGRLTAEIAFEREDAWFLIRYFIFREEKDMPTIMWSYLNSFSTNPHRNSLVREPVRGG